MKTDNLVTKGFAVAIFFMIAVPVCDVVNGRRAHAQDTGCVSEWVIDVCDFGCDAAFGTCDLGCDAAFGACDLGCDTCDFGCNVAFGTCDAGCDTCYVGCDAAFGTCDAGCYACEATVATCEALCEAAEGTCGALCSGAEWVCKGPCYTGCYVGLGWCKDLPWWASCRGAFNDCMSACDSGCDIECENCILDCKAGCDIDCDNCWGTCNSERSNCESACDDCQGTCDSERASCESACDDCQGTCDSERAGCEGTCDSARADCEGACDDYYPCQKVGESCQPIPGLPGECEYGLTCFFTAGLVNDQPFTCFPSETDELIPDEVCKSLYVEELQEAAIDAGVTMSYGTSIASSAFVGQLSEVGAVYGADGCYGCYIMQCFGGGSEVGAGSAACVGAYSSLDTFQGQSILSVEEAGAGVVFQTVQAWSVTDVFIGTADCVAIQFAPDDFIVPLDAGVYECQTVVDIAYCLDDEGNAIEPPASDPPEAACTDDVVCAAPDRCMAISSIDNGSFDPDGESVFLSHDPPLVSGMGQHTVTLTVSDPGGATDSCAAQVTVMDCDPPAILEPDDVVVGAIGLSGQVVDIGIAEAHDNCDPAPVITNDAPGLFPVGTTTVTWTATDAAGNEATGTQQVTVEYRIPGDMDGDGDVDRGDVNRILALRNQPAEVAPECDLDGDGVITVLDARKCVLLCTCPRCVCP